MAGEIDQAMTISLMKFIGKIQAALGTEENGEALIEVARNAHEAEQREARFLNLIGTTHGYCYSVERAYQKVYGDWKEIEKKPPAPSRKTR